MKKLHQSHLLSGVLFLVTAVLADVAGTPRTQAGRTVAIDPPGLGPLLRGPRVLEPVDDVINVQGLPVASRLQRVELTHVVLDLLARRVLVLAEPALESRQLEFRVKARAHARLVRVGQQTWVVMVGTGMMLRAEGCGTRDHDFRGGLG